MKTLELINSIPSTKEGLQETIQSVKNNILEENIDPLKVSLQLRMMEDLVKALRGDSEISELIENEFNKHSEKELELHGATFTKREVGVKYDFTNCGDSAWHQINGELGRHKQSLKDRETFLKTIKEGMDIPDPETGEILSPPGKTSTTKIVVNLK